MTTKSGYVAEALLAMAREEKVQWDWIADHPHRPLTKREANKFLLGCVVDYAQDADMAWTNVREFTEGTLGDPEALWLCIAQISFRSWMAKRRAYALHRYRKAHERVWRIAKRIVVEYSGDARNIWSGCDASVAREKLLNLGLGEQLSRMAVIAFLRTNRIRGSMDVKADTHVRRVLGRVFRGRSISADDAVSISRRLCPRDPSLLDAPLYLIGRNICFARTPACRDCCLAPGCLFLQDSASEGKSQLVTDFVNVPEIPNPVLRREGTTNAQRSGDPF